MVRQIEIIKDDGEVNEKSELLNANTRMMAQNENPVRWGEINGHEVFLGTHLDTKKLFSDKFTSDVKYLEGNNHDCEDMPMGSHTRTLFDDHHSSKQNQLNNQQTMIDTHSDSQQKWQHKSTNKIQIGEITRYDEENSEECILIGANTKMPKENQNCSRLGQTYNHKILTNDETDFAEHHFNEEIKIAQNGKLINHEGENSDKSSFNGAKTQGILEDKNHSRWDQTKGQDTDTTFYRDAPQQMHEENKSHLQSFKITDQNGMDTRENTAITTHTREMNYENEMNEHGILTPSHYDTRQLSQTAINSQIHYNKTSTYDRNTNGRPDLMGPQTTIINDNENLRCKI